MALPFKRLKTELDFLDTLGFGSKYFDKTISYILEFDPEYLEWCCKQANLVYLSDKCHTALESRLQLLKAIKEVKAANNKFSAPKSKFRDWFAHADQDDWWDDVPF